jgi:hypothetical protein
MADTSVVLVSNDGHIALTEGATDSVATGSVVLSNATGEPAPVSVEPGSEAPEACEISASPEAVEALRQQKVTLTFTNCEVDSTAVLFNLTAGASSFPALTADSPTAADPDWRMWGFAIAFAIAVILLLIAFALWNNRAAETSFRASLPGITPSYKFSDSWATSATVVAAAFVAIFGASSTIGETIFGADTKTATAVIAVAAATGTGLVGLSPLVLQALRSWDGETTKVYGLLAAALLTLTGTLGQMIVIVLVLRATSLGDGPWATDAGIVAGLIILWYALAATYQNLELGKKVPKPASKGLTPATDEELAIGYDLADLGVEERRALPSGVL